MVGEQPGDKEDLDGHPFVGPAGRLLDRALAAAGIDRRTIYLTNAVKHFKWKRGNGKVRLHQKPNREEVRACACWWEAELDAVQPELVVLLGATAAQAVLGPKVRVTRDRGSVLPCRRRARVRRVGDDPPIGDPAHALSGTRRRVRRARRATSRVAADHVAR